MRKKLVLVLCAMLMLAGCQRVVVPASGAASNNVVPEPESTPPSGLQGTEPLPDTVPVGTLRILRSAIGYSASPDGVYAIRLADHNASLIEYADYATGEQKVLCARQGCAHADESCNAWLENFYSNIVYAGDKLHVINWGYAEPFAPIQASIIQMDADGSNRKTLVEFNEGWTASEAFCTDDQTLFVVCYFTNTKESAVPGQNDVVGETFALVGIDLRSGEQVLCYLLGRQYPVGVMKDKIILVENSDYNDTGILLRGINSYSPATGLCETLIKGPFGLEEGNRFAYFIDGSYYGTTGTQYKDMRLVRTELPAGTVTPLLDPIPGDSFNIYDMGHIYNGKLCGSVGNHTNFTDRYVAVDIQTGEWADYPQMVQEEAFEYPMAIIAEHGDEYIVLHKVERYNIIGPNGEGGESMQSSQRMVFGRISQAGYWDGTGESVPFAGR